MKFNIFSYPDYTRRKIVSVLKSILNKISIRLAYRCTSIHSYKLPVELKQTKEARIRSCAHDFTHSVDRNQAVYVFAKNVSSCHDEPIAPLSSLLRSRVCFVVCFTTNYILMSKFIEVVCLICRNRLPQS